MDQTRAIHFAAGLSFCPKFGRIGVMSTKTYQKMKAEIKEELVREFITPILADIKDAEGDYRSEFVKRVLKAVGENPPYSYDPKGFLKLS